jgi:hypothetical protein
MNTVYVRPRLDRCYDVIQTRVPQFLGMRPEKADALALAERAAQRSTPSKVVVFGLDGTSVETTREFPASAGAPAAP